MRVWVRFLKSSKYTCEFKLEFLSYIKKIKNKIERVNIKIFINQVITCGVSNGDIQDSNLYPIIMEL